MPVLLGSYLSVPSILAASDAWALLPRPYAESLAESGIVALLPGPVELRIPPLTMLLQWPDAQDAAPASLWIRHLLLEILTQKT